MSAERKHKPEAEPVIFWFRSDLRLADNAGLTAAVQSGRDVIPVYILDDHSPQQWKRGGASRWWLHQSLLALDADLQKSGFHPLVCLHGAAGDVLDAVISETGASGVYWNRCYEPWAMARDKEIKQNLKSRGLDAQSFGGYLLFEPWDIKNKTGGDYKVFTPFSRACLDRAGTLRPPLDVCKPLRKYTGRIFAPENNPPQLALMPRIKWYHGMAAEWTPGEAGAWKRFSYFADDGAWEYKNTRDFPAVDGVSKLSPFLHFGEISPYQIWHSISSRIADTDNPQGPAHAQGFLRQILWREFSYHLLFHAPDFPDKPWNKKFAHFPWQPDEAAQEKWRRGQTGYPIIDAGMRQLWQTGWMHNRVRMIVGSFFVKNLLQPWRDGEDWFWDTLVDADLGNNAAGWQWIAGCGADAAPYFRIFNPVLQSQKFDPDGAYIRHYVPELAHMPDRFIHAPWTAPPLLRAEAAGYVPPMVDINASRDRALEAYAISKSIA